MSRRSAIVAGAVLAVLGLAVTRLPPGSLPRAGTVPGYVGELRHCVVSGAGPRTLPSTVAVDPAAALRYAEEAQASRPDPAQPPSHLANVVVAVLDSGVDAEHPALSQKVIAGRDALNPCGTGRTDPAGHGTAVAGVVISNSGGEASTVRIMPVRVLHRDGASSRIATAAGMIWAVNAGADIINASLSAPTYSVLERTAIRYAEKRGVLVVVAAGNVAGSRARYPASLPNVASVTALDREGRVASWATRNASTDLAAFGEDVPVLIAGGGHRTARGTSYAAPRIAAAAARLLVARPDLTLPQLRRLLRDQYSPPVQRAV